MSIEYFGVNSTYSPFSDSMSLRTVTNEKFEIPNAPTFLNKPVIGVATGLIPTNSSFLDESFKVVVEEQNGNELIKLTKVLGKKGTDTYPTEYEVMWFDSENMQSVFWVNEKWANQVLSITGDFLTTTLTAEELMLLIDKADKVGSVTAWAGSIEDIPKYALLCDGREVSRTTYRKLFNKIGTTWGEGDGIETFNIPDGRGGVLKGAGSSSKYLHNENRGAVGSYQSTAIRNITGIFGTGYSNVFSFGAECFYGVSHGSNGFKNGDSYNYNTIGFNAARVVPTGQTNRDNNLAVHWIIFT